MGTPGFNAGVFFVRGGRLAGDLGSVEGRYFPAFASIVLEEAQSALPHLLARQDVSPLEKKIGSVAHVFSSSDVNPLTDLLGTLRRQIRGSSMRTAIRARRFDEAAALAAVHQGPDVI